MHAAHSGITASGHMQMLFKSAARKARATKNVTKIKSAELLMLQISIQWPLSIVLSPRSMRMYQFCFRHLLNCKVLLTPPWAPPPSAWCRAPRLPKHLAVDHAGGICMAHTHAGSHASNSW